MLPSLANNTNREHEKIRSDPEKRIINIIGVISNIRKRSSGVEGNILPVDLRIEEIAKIRSKNIAEPVKQQLEEYLRRDDIYEQQESPFGKAINQ